MTTVYFKQTPGGSAKSFSAYYLEIFYKDSEKTEYTDISFNLKKIVHGVHKCYEIVLGYIATDADLDWLATLKGYDNPQFSVDGSTYITIIIESVKPKKVGTTITVINQATGF